MFACGHRGGLLIELWPGDIIHIGSLTGSANGVLELFERIGNTMSYDNDEELCLVSSEDADFWLQEIEALQQSLDGHGKVPRQNIERLMDGFVEVERFHARHDGNEHTLTPAMYVERAKERIRRALTDAVALCRTSIDIGNPIRLLW